MSSGSVRVVFSAPAKVHDLENDVPVVDRQVLARLVEREEPAVLLSEKFDRALLLDDDVALEGGTMELRLTPEGLRLVSVYTAGRPLTGEELDELFEHTQDEWFGGIGSIYVSDVEEELGVSVTPERGLARIDEGGSDPNDLPRGPSVAAQGLLLQLGRHPADERTRQQLIETLASEGEPWADVLRLPESDPRSSELISRHGKRWLGSLAPAALLSRCAFERGLLTELYCTAFADDAIYARFAGHPHLASVSRLRIFPRSVETEVEVLADPVLAKLDDLSLTDGVVARLRGARLAWKAWRLIMGGIPAPATMDDLAAQPAFSMLRVLDLRGVPHEIDRLRAVALHPTGQRLEWLLVHGDAWTERDIVAWLTAAPRLMPNATRHTVVGRCWYELQLGASGGGVALYVETGRKGVGVGEAVNVLALLPAGSVSSLEVKHVGHDRFLHDFRRTLEQAAARLGARQTVLPPTE